MNKFMAPLAVVVLAAQVSANPDFNPPSWRGQPNSTVQGWDFIFGNTYAGDLADDRVVPLRNPNELPPRIIPFSTNEPITPHVFFIYRQVISQPNLTDTFITLLPAAANTDPARIAFAIPNFESNSGLLMRIQLTYRCTIAPEFNIVHATDLTRQDITINDFSMTDRIDPDRGNWNQATYNFEFNRTSGWQAVDFSNTSGFNLDIESIVIDTIVIPAPSAAGGLFAFGLIAARRRRR